MTDTKTIDRFLLELHVTGNIGQLPPVLPVTMLHEAYLTKKYSEEISLEDFLQNLRSRLDALREKTPSLLKGYLYGQRSMKDTDLNGLYSFARIQGLREYTRNAIQTCYQGRITAVLMDTGRKGKVQVC